MMQGTRKFDPMGFLNDRRERSFNSAMVSANMRYQATVSNYAHVYERISNRGKAFDTREWGIGFIMDAFSSDEGARRKEVNNISGIMFDDLYFVYFKLVNDLEQIPPESKTIAQARIRATQLPLGFEEVELKEIPLHNLYFILGAYQKTGGLITGLFFVDQSEEVPLIRQLNIFASTRPEIRQVEQPQKTKLTLKPGATKKDKVE